MTDGSVSESEPPTVYELAEDCTIDDLEEGGYYRARVDAVVEYGMFVQLAAAVSGLVHESNYDGGYDEGDELVVRLTAIKENGDLAFVPVDLDGVETERVEHEYDVVDVADLDDAEGETVHLEAEIVQIKQTAGPTLFHAADGTGIVPCAAFERAGVRAYPDVSIGDPVHVVGRAERGRHGLQIETDAIDRLDGDRADEFRERYEESLAEHVTAAEVEPFIEWPALAKLLPGLERATSHLKRAVLEGRPVVVRHHADTDGMCASVPVEVAVERFVGEVHHDPDAVRHLVKRLPSKAPFYEMEDATRDLSHALSGQARHGQKLPLLLMIDNGSTEEDVPAYRYLGNYDVPILAIDHHHPDPEAVEPYLAEHVNPYLHDEDYRVTAGMLCVELARMIAPDLGSELEHVPAVAGLADRSDADAMEDYLALAIDAGYEEDDLVEIGDALDYAAHLLRYNAGRGVTNDVLNVDGDEDRHEAVVELLASRARRDIARQLDDALPHVEVERLDNDVRLHRLDVDRHAHRFTYPAPGTTTGAIHDHMVGEHDEPAITIGYGPDFAVLRSDGVRLDIPQMVSDLNEDLAGAGVSGGGHLVVGSIKFVEGMREAVLDALVEEMADAEIDESLGAAAPRTYDVDES